MDNNVTEPAFRAVLAAHYIGVCERLDLNVNAELIALNSLLNALEINSEDLFRSRQYEEEMIYIDRLREQREELSGLAREEIQIRASRFNQMVYYNPNRSTFIIGERTMRIGLSQFAMDALSWLQGSNDRFAFSAESNQAFLELRAENDEGQEEPDFDLRGDGVLSEWQ